MPVTARFTFPGEPITKLPAGITVRSVISAPAATMLPAPIVTPFKMTAPIPIKQRDSMVQPCSVTERSEEHTSELQSHLNLVCRLLLEKKKKTESTVLI